MLVSKIKPCTSKYTQYSETENGSSNQLWFKMQQESDCSAEFEILKKVQGLFAHFFLNSELGKKYLVMLLHLHGINIRINKIETS